MKIYNIPEKYQRKNKSMGAIVQIYNYFKCKNGIIDVL